MVEWSTSHKWRNWYEPLTACAMRMGDCAIHVDVIQDMARAASDPDAYPVTRWKVEHFLNRIREHVGSDWPIQKVLTDWNPGTSDWKPLALGQRLHSAIGELIGLDLWLDAGWRPMQVGGKDGPDWRLQRGQRAAAVEVKWRQHPKRMQAYLDWAVKGQKMLPGFQWMNDYTWCWRTTPPDLGECERAIRWWLRALPTIEHYIDSSKTAPIGRASQFPECDLEITGWGYRQPIILRGTQPGLRCLIELTTYASADMFMPGSDRTYWPAPIIGEEEGQLLRDAIVGRIVDGARKQLGEDTICCILWTVPEGWEQAMKEEWILDQLRRLPEDQQCKPIGICPLGHIEWGGLRLILNEPALRLIAD